MLRSFCPSRGAPPQAQAVGPPLHPHVPTRQSAVIAILEEQYRASEL